MQMQTRAAVALLMPALALASAGAEPIQTVHTSTSASTLIVESLASGLEHPWGMAFLPDGGLLVTERAGRLRLLSAQGALSEPLAGTPAVLAEGQGGLLDVALDPEFESNRLVWLSYAEPGTDGASTALGHGRLQEGRLEGFQAIFRQQPKVSGSAHFGGRIVFRSDGTLFLTTGERFRFDPAQDLSSHLGKIIRIGRDGSAPDDNPFVGQADARPEIWSYGHRNVESAALHPQTGALWIAEMGPEGGDELNQPEAGKNYGWPEVSWGRHYDGGDIPDPPTHPEFVDAVKQWTPVIAPSGMAFYTADLFPGWRHSLLIGGLKNAELVRITLSNGRVADEERIPLQARIRDVEQAPDGSVWVLTDQVDGHIWRLAPEP